MNDFPCIASQNATRFWHSAIHFKNYIADSAIQLAKDCFRIFCLSATTRDSKLHFFDVPVQIPTTVVNSMCGEFIQRSTDWIYTYIGVPHNSYNERCFVKVYAYRGHYNSVNSYCVM